MAAYPGQIRRGKGSVAGMSIADQIKGAAERAPIATMLEGVGVPAPIAVIAQELLRAFLSDPSLAVDPAVAARRAAEVVASKQATEALIDYELAHTDSIDKKS